MGTPVGYIRQSRRADLDVALSYDTQLAAIRRMAGDDVAVLSDMGRSGKAGGERLRPGYQRLLAGIESGEYSAVYAIALSRFARSIPVLHELLELVKVRGVTLTTAKEGTMDPHTATGRMIYNTWSNFAEFVRDMAVEAALENSAERRSRGQRMGRIPYGSREGDRPDLVLAAWEASGGSLVGTARLLNRDGVPSWQGTRTRDGHAERVEWSASSVRGIIARLVPGAIRTTVPRGVKPTASFALSRLLLCPCGRLLTGAKDPRGDYGVVYRCHEARVRPDHAPAYRVWESALLPALMAEAAHLRIPGDAVESPTADKAERAALEAKRLRVKDMYEDGVIDKPERTTRLEAIGAALERLDTAQTIRLLPPEPIDWNLPPRAVNRILRALWDRVELGPDLLPVRYVWRVPEWRE